MSAERPLRERDPIAADRRTDTPAQVASAKPSVPAGWDESADLERDPAVVPQLADIDVPDALREELEALVARYPHRRSAALPALHAAQRVHGWCSPEAIDQVAAVMRVTPAYLASLTTFYDMFNTEPVGRSYVYVCTSVACNLVGAQDVFESLRQAGEELEDVHVRQFECLGACDMAPMASVDGRYIGPLDPSDAPEVARAIRAGEKPLPGRGLETIDEPPGAAEAGGGRGEGGARRGKTMDDMGRSAPDAGGGGRAKGEAQGEQGDGDA